MIYDCLKTGGGRQGGYIWVWILLFLNVIGAGLYFFIIWLPNHPNAFGDLPWIHQGKLRNALWQAQADAKNIGKAKQYQRLGDIHYQMRDLESAKIAYNTALAKEPNNCKVIWGIACVAMEQKDFETAREHLQHLISLEPEFAYGEASFAYASVLHQLKELELAEEHLQKHIKLWCHPPTYMMLAEIYEQREHKEQARDILETMIIKIKSSTPFQYRKNEGFIRQAERILKKL